MQHTKTADYNFDLPQHLIAQMPVTPRDHSRMMQVDRRTGQTDHRRFYDLPDILRPGDLLVVNDSRVLPARLYAQKEDTGAAVELLLLEQKRPDVWEVMVRPGKKAREGARFVIGDGLMRAEILQTVEGGNRLAVFQCEGGFYETLDKIGHMPLPPYITQELQDSERYQTVYSKQMGSAAAPTAGLHFTPELIRRLEEGGVRMASVTLHVGLGTFRPVKAQDITQHKMHAEHYSVPQETAALIQQTKERGGRVIAVGTTSTRTLESVYREHGEVAACEGYTDIFLHPGSTFGVLDGLITNFHLPQSTLIMLVSAFLGYENTMAAYREAVEEQYRFFSFGDCMLIL